MGASRFSPEDVIIADFEHRLRLPDCSLRQGRVIHIASARDRAVWTARGGIVACEEEGLTSALSAAIDDRRDDDPFQSPGHLEEVLRRGQPELDCALNLLLCCQSPRPVPPEVAPNIAMFSPRDLWTGEDLDPRQEHVFATRDGSVLASYAYNVPQIEAAGHRFHAVGVQTRPEYRGRGLGKAVVSALVEHVASEGGVALYVCDVRNVASYRLARSVGFVPVVWDFRWRPRAV